VVSSREQYATWGKRPLALFYLLNETGFCRLSENNDVDAQISKCKVRIFPLSSSVEFGTLCDGNARLGL
jgi:hypothetical protein